MKRAMEETGRRRKRQITYNKTHGIIPQSITKSIPEQTAAPEGIMHKSSHDLKREKDRA